jgi:hypothetical protein
MYQQLKAHPVYKRAKAGEQNAALELVLDVAVAWLYEHRGRFGPGLLFVAPHAQETTGDNAIPQTLASVCAAIFKGQVDTEIVQSDRVYHTGADPMERMPARAQFEGRVIKERLDDEFAKVFGIEPAALKANEAAYLVGFKSIDGLRNRLATAEQEIDRRLRSKGIG